MKNIYYLSIICLVTFSCMSPMDKKYSETGSDEDIELISKELDSTELDLLFGNMIRLKLQNKKLEEMTYTEILEDGKKWKKEQDKLEAKQRELAANALKTENNRIKRLSESLLVSCYSKGFIKYDYEDYITYKFVIQNKTEKTIRAIKGSITFTNLFDETIKSLNFVYDQPIGPGLEITYNAQTDYNQFTDSDKALKNKELKDMKVIWKPEKIIFQDGSTLE